MPDTVILLPGDVLITFKYLAYCIITMIVLMMISIFLCSNSSSDDDDAVSYNPTNPNTPIYERPISQYSIEDLVSMLLDPCDKSLICTERPTDIRCSATFLINLDSLKHPDDVKQDNFGKWNQSGSHTVPFQSWYTEGGVLQFKRLRQHDASSVSDVQYIRRLHYYHPSDARCKRMLAFITGKCFIKIYHVVFL